MDEEYKHNHLEHKRRLIKIKGSMDTLPPIHNPNGKYSDSHRSMDFDLFKNSLPSDKKNYRLNRDIDNQKSKSFVNRARVSVKKGDRQKRDLFEREEDNTLKSKPSQEILKENDKVTQKVHKDNSKKEITQDFVKESYKEADKGEEKEIITQEVKSDSKDVIDENAKVDTKEIHKQIVEEGKKESPSQNVKEDAKDLQNKSIEEKLQKEIKETHKKDEKERLEEVPLSEPKEVLKADVKEIPKIESKEAPQTTPNNE